MATVADAIDSYRSAIETIERDGRNAPRETVLQMLIARDAIAGYFDGESETAADVLAVGGLDDRLLNLKSHVLALVPVKTFETWRRSVEPGQDVWWWNEIDKALFTLPLPLKAFVVVAWICIAVCLSYVLEILRRILIGGTDVLSTVLQGLLALLIGGTIVQFARGLIDRATRTQKRSVASRIGPPAAYLVVSIVAVFLLDGFQSSIAGYYRERGDRSVRRGQLTEAIGQYQRAINLLPDDSHSHFGLGIAYERVKEYDKAMVEYQTAILANDTVYGAYIHLARLQMLQHEDYARALELLTPPVRNVLGQERYSILAYRGWAYLGLGYLQQARQDLESALTIVPNGVEALYLLGNVHVAGGDSLSAARCWTRCRDITSRNAGQRVRMRPEWRDRLIELGLTRFFERWR